MERAAQQDEQAGRYRPWETLAAEVLHDEVPPLWPELGVIFDARAGCASDANGRALRTELNSYLDDEQILDEGERSAYHRLVRAIDSETARVTTEQMEALQHRE